MLINTEDEYINNTRAIQKFSNFKNVIGHDFEEGIITLCHLNVYHMLL